MKGDYPIRVFNTIRNVIAGYVGQILGLLMALLTRTILINHISITYVGLNGLFTNLLTIFSLASFGISSALSYSLYKPLKEGDYHQLAQIFYLLKRYNRYIGMAIFAIGISFIPLLDWLVLGGETVEGYYGIYLVFLLSNVTPYFIGSAEKILLNADQKLYVILFYRYVFLILMDLAQIIVILLTGNYLIYITVQLVKVIFMNVAINKHVKRHYSVIERRKGNTQKLIDGDKIKTNIKHIFTYRLGSIILKGTDNLVITKFVGLAATGLYSNYFMIVTTAGSLISILYRSVTASIGNFNVDSKTEGKEKIFDVLLFITNCIYGICFLGIYLLLNDVIRFWLGKRYLIDMMTVFFIGFAFYLEGMRQPYLIQRQTMGIFKQGRYITLIMAGINLTLSIILAGIIGLPGIFIGTTVGYLLTSYWYDPLYVSKYAFQKSSGSLYKKQLQYSLLTVITFVSGVLIFGEWYPQRFGELVIKVLTVSVFAGVIHLVAYFNRWEFRYLLEKIRPIFMKISRHK